MRFVALFLIVCIVLPAGVWGAPATSEPAAFTPAVGQTLDAGLTKAFDTHITPSVSVAIVDHGRIVFSRAVGMADVGKQVPATVHTRYHAGSISKMFTAVAVMQQVDRKKVALDARLDTWLPWAPHASEVTIRQLLMHRSGMPDYLDAAIGSGAVSKPITPRGIIDTLAGRPLDFKPGTAYEYCNTNYVLLGLVVEKVSGSPLGEYQKKNIFDVAGMSETTFGDPPSGVPSAVGYGPMTAGTPPAVQNPGDMSWYYACGSLVSTADDLARFDIALMGGKLVPSAVFASMAAAAEPTGGVGGPAYGLGVQTFPLASGKRLIGHHGGIPGFESDDEMIPADQFAVISLGNDFAWRTGLVTHLGLATFYPAMVAALEAQKPAAPVDRDPALTVKLTEFMKSLQAGKLSALPLAPALASAFGPDKLSAIGAQFTALGNLEGVVYYGEQRIGTDIKYFYMSKFEKKALQTSFVINNQGQLAGLFFSW